MSNDSWPAAQLSSDGLYRYFLSRRLAFLGPRVAFIGLNPSTADAVMDDPTIRRCKGFAAGWGASELWMVNLFAYRATDPAVLRTATDPVGPDNDAWLERTVQAADVVVAAWGHHGSLLGRAADVQARYAGKLNALGVTKAGMPKHPLYLRASTSLQPLSNSLNATRPSTPA